VIALSEYNMASGKSGMAPERVNDFETAGFGI
jgi:hypothetical protein